MLINYLNLAGFYLDRILPAVWLGGAFTGVVTTSLTVLSLYNPTLKANIRE